MELLGPIQDAFGGGALTPILLAGGLVALFVAYKVVRFVSRLVALGVAAALFVGTAPLASAELDTPAAACAQRAVEEDLDPWQALIIKRVTVESVSPDAACADGGVGLAQGTAQVKLRTFLDAPLRTWTVTPQGVDGDLLF